MFGRRVEIAFVVASFGVVAEEMLLQFWEVRMMKRWIDVKSIVFATGILRAPTVVIIMWSWLRSLRTPGYHHHVVCRLTGSRASTRYD